jgi:DNA-binding NtrC family response regulator
MSEDPIPPHVPDPGLPAVPAIPASPSTHFGELIGASVPMRELFAVLERVAQSDVGVLIEGETGTGKELAAEALHRGSPRTGPLVICDLAGVSRSLIESELFGHVRGAFTGADRDRDGAFVQAASGTIFIDEIAELELDAQPRLLRALERRQVKPVGGSSYRDLDVRVIAASNRDLREEVRAGRFREDLYHRLAVIQVRIPSLRERREDIPLLVEHLLARAATHAQFSDAAMQALCDYRWPGNVRELKNVLDRALSLLPPPADGAPAADRAITPELLGLPPLPPDATPQAGPLCSARFRDAKERMISAWERAFVARLLERSGGNVTRAARDGGMDRVYLHRLMKKHHIDGRVRIE